MTDSVVLSYDLHVLCADRGRLVTQSLDRLDDFSSLVFLSSVGKGVGFRKGATESQWLDLGTLSFGRSLPRGWIELEERRNDPGVVRLKPCGVGSQNAYLYTTHSGAIDSSERNVHDKTRVFRCVTLDELKALREFVRTPWLGENARVPSFTEASSSNIWDITLGETIFAFDIVLRAALAYSERTDAFDIVLYNSGNIWRFVKFNPALLFIITNVEDLPKFSCALRWIARQGKFDNKLIIASVLDYESVISFIPQEWRAYIKFVPIIQKDIKDRCVPLLSVLASIDIKEFYPLVVMSHDVLITGNFRSYLLEAALCRQVSDESVTGRESVSVEERENPFIKDDVSCEPSVSLFPGGRIRGAIAFLQNKSFLKTALFSFRALVMKGGYFPVEGSEADFLAYLANKYSLCLSLDGKESAREERQSFSYMDVSGWSLEQCNQFIDASNSIQDV
ncbi:hypothetical protein PT277_06895 [Acetobacteraceae bacterium ESL0709]|nr:hypothetical protein [Acetobacteraceae bacterium ESL0697]MDF7678419.1 hypothetical protein [Acetobacteraceae bacterium ESL0709]